MTAARRHDDDETPPVQLQLTIEHLEIIGKHVREFVTQDLKADIAILTNNVDGLKQSTRHEFTMMHGRMSGLGDDVKAMDKRINGRLSKAEMAVAELAMKFAIREATAGNQAQRDATTEAAVARVAVTRRDVAMATAIVGGIVGGIYAIAEMISKLGPLFGKLLKP